MLQDLKTKKGWDSFVLVLTVYCIYMVQYEKILKDLRSKVNISPPKKVNLMLNGRGGTS
jgi:hypothetical protein